MLYDIFDKLSYVWNMSLHYNDHIIKLEMSSGYLKLQAATSSCIYYVAVYLLSYIEVSDPIIYDSIYEITNWS